MTDAGRSDVSAILDAMNHDEPGAVERLFDVVYDELHRMAGARMHGEAVRGTLQTTALVHEAYLRLLKGKSATSWQNRRHFFGAAAQAMRRILIERARRRGAVAHGGDLKRVSLDDCVPDAERPSILLSLDEALDRLAQERPRQAEVVQYRYFLGLTVEETADLLDVSHRTVDNDWAFARAWLRREIAGDENGAERDGDGS